MPVAHLVQIGVHAVLRVGGRQIVDFSRSALCQTEGAADPHGQRHPTLSLAGSAGVHDPRVAC